jgi:biotin transporter BioY
VHVGFIVGFIATSISLSILLVRKKREGRVGKDALVTLGAGAAVMAAGSAIMIYNLLQYLWMI